MEITEDFDAFVARVIRKLVIRLIAIEGGNSDDALSKIKMSKHLTRTLDEQVRLLILYGVDDRRDLFLGEALESERPERPHTWREVGKALGVSAQAAQRKYGSTSDESTALP